MSFSLRALLGTLALGLAFNSMAAADWPPAGKAVQIIVPAPAGGGTGDSIARLIAEGLAKELNGNFVIDNHGGANGNIGAGIAAAAKPDGSKLLFSWAGTLAVSPALYQKLQFDPQKSFDMIGLVAEVPNILVVSPNLPVDSVKSFADYVKQHPGQVNFGSTGNGSSMHLAGELFMAQTGTNMLHIPYSAPGQATTNLITGEIQAMFQLIPGIVGQVKAGQVKALAVTSATRAATLPDVPTTVEQGYPELLSSTWFALLAPKGTPPEIIASANQALNKVLAQPDVKDKLANLGATTLGGTPAQADALLDSELKKWAKIVEDAGISVQ
ncbi:Bug family tripartite tricarboxylate transporter substrate binding protein [Alcaligenes sp. WGS1538]|uniref:Bug family tripartite tricarboxylate transporter substrate binding protein n=1 Tax=Alcaligenes sp. WGS1538 TaxID=3366811 RepID=UPI00372D727A